MGFAWALPYNFTGSSCSKVNSVLEITLSWGMIAAGNAAAVCRNNSAAASACPRRTPSRNSIYFEKIDSSAADLSPH